MSAFVARMLERDRGDEEEVLREHCNQTGRWRTNRPRR
jgi:hypothetical protein